MSEDNTLYCPKCSKVTLSKEKCSHCNHTLLEDCSAMVSSQTVFFNETTQGTDLNIDSSASFEATVLDHPDPEKQTTQPQLHKTPIKDVPSCNVIGQHFGRCKVIEKIGQGGMGMVYKAHHQTLDQFVVLKVLPQKMADSQEFRERFIREARACAKLYHQNVVQVLDAGYENEVYFYLMEFVDGASLEDYVGQGKKFEIEEICRIMRDAASGLQVAHEQGIVHRDIKASNIMLTNSGQVKVADFGLACDLEADRISMTGQVMGTPHYMSPEQWDGQQVDERSDLYSLGITFFYLLTGRLPFQAKSAATLCKMHTMENVPSLSSLGVKVPAPVEIMVQKLLKKDQNHRYANAGQFVESVNQYLSGNFKSNHSKWIWLRRGVFLFCVITLIAISLVQYQWKNKQKNNPKQNKNVAVDTRKTKDNQKSNEKIEEKNNKETDDKKETSEHTNDSKNEQENDNKNEQENDSKNDTKEQSNNNEIETLKIIELPLANIAKSPKMVKGPFVIKGKLTAPLPEGAKVVLEIRGKKYRKQHPCKISNQVNFLGKLTLPEGKYMYKAAVILTGHKTKSGKTHRTIVDLHPPRIKIISPVDGTIYDQEKDGTKIDLQVHVEDYSSGISKVWVKHNDKRFLLKKRENNIYECTLNLKWGKQQFTLSAFDKAGHQSETNSSIILVPEGMIRIPRISFIMKGKKVQLEPFYINRLETSNGDYRSFLNQTGHEQPPRWKPVSRQNKKWAKEPVTFVSHYDAQEYCRHAEKRLPTEAEWIVAALWCEGKIRNYPWGNTAKKMTWPSRITETGLWDKDTSFLGCKDMAANASEWVADKKGDKAVRKGGYNLLRKKTLERLKWATINYWENRNKKTKWLGFRCALSEK